MDFFDFFLAFLTFLTFLTFFWLFFDFFWLFFDFFFTFFLLFFYFFSTFFFYFFSLFWLAFTKLGVNLAIETLNSIFLKIFSVSRIPLCNSAWTSYSKLEKSTSINPQNSNSIKLELEKTWKTCITRAKLQTFEQKSSLIHAPTRQFETRWNSNSI